ncbi:Na+/H+-dicarboxylate symporter [Povalibacter uvarum]|uniref:Na+/H+-dicarboxylate symporter n=1 Tax=Povalibacter uvarum TaxID=732238 RepID=A0A841HQI3_9GAMM|nr:cation:dicarboxylase symporter family transporter [Povalibacter uvarum]MBB6095136.1 Na+/H+-dicarboxylate symporter [Povalibacter uvarum]
MSPSTRIVIGLIAGLAAGATLGAIGNPALIEGADFVVLIGELWVKALQMTVIPLLISLLITGMAAAKDTAESGRLAGRALALFGIFLAGSVSLALIVIPLALSIWPVDSGSAAALLSGLKQSASQIPEMAPLREWISNIVPTNPFRAAADGAILPLVVFTLMFALAATRLPATQRSALVGFFQAASAALLIVVQWVLKVAAIGVFALSLNVGMRGGVAAAGAIGHYLLLMCSLAILITLVLYPVVVFFGRISLRQFAKAVAPAQAVAFSTQSSLASLPAMLTTAQSLGVPARVADVVLPLAVSIFKLTSPALNLSIVLFIAHVSGIDLTPAQFLVGAAVAILTSFGIAGIPGQASFLTTAVPIAIAMGVPIELALLLLAVEVIPDIFRTVGNVTADVVVTAIIGRHHSATAQEAATAAPASNVDS